MLNSNTTLKKVAKISNLKFVPVFLQTSSSGGNWWDELWLQIKQVFVQWQRS